MKKLKGTMSENRGLIAMFLLVLIGAPVGSLIVKRLTPLQQPTQTVNYQHFELDGGLREVSIYDMGKDKKDIVVRDIRDCHDNPAEDAACLMTEYLVGPDNKFLRRESYHFNHGSKIWVGEVRQVGEKEDYHQEASWGVGNPIPYAFQTYADKSGDRRIALEQEQLNNLLKEVDELPKG